MPNLPATTPQYANRLSPGFWKAVRAAQKRQRFWKAVRAALGLKAKP